MKQSLNPLAPGVEFRANIVNLQHQHVNIVIVTFLLLGC